MNFGSFLACLHGRRFGEGVWARLYFYTCNACAFLVYTTNTLVKTPCFRTSHEKRRHNMFTIKQLDQGGVSLLNFTPEQNLPFLLLQKLVFLLTVRSSCMEEDPGGWNWKKKNNNTTSSFFSSDASSQSRFSTKFHTFLILQDNDFKQNKDVRVKFYFQLWFTYNDMKHMHNC